MKNIWLVAKREFLSRVQKKSFIVMTILGPILIAAFYGVIIWISISNIDNKELKEIAIADYSGLIDKLENETYWNYTVIDSLNNPGQEVLNSVYYASVVIPKDFSLEKPDGGKIISKQSISLSNQQHLENKIKQIVYQKKLEQSGISKSMLDSLQTKVSLQSIKNTESGSVTSVAEINTVIGYMAAFAIYLFIFIYGAQVMRGVLEEKTNRIVEVIVSSVKPFQLMAGKIFGVVLVGLTQLMVWIILSGVFITVLSVLIGGNIQNPAMPMEMSDASAINSVGNKGVASILQGLNALNLPLLLGAFVFYFLGGYLFYSALFAAIAAAVDNETDTQQFMLPVTLPLVLGIVIAMSVVTSNPHGSMAYWFSMIPFTSPVVMMVRLPFDVPLPELLLSMFLLILGFLFTTWLASRIYRVGILMYGKKATYKELWKWITYKN